jgi:heme O synthase-like polyprenyltransferase
MTKRKIIGWSMLAFFAVLWLFILLTIGFANHNYGLLFTVCGAGFVLKAIDLIDSPA